MAGTRSKQEDQIVTEAIQKATGARFIYVPERGGGAVAVQLGSNRVDSTVNNPIEASARGAAGNYGRSACSMTSRWTIMRRLPGI
jgi:putative tricarboxylic transport membrane protein